MKKLLVLLAVCFLTPLAYCQSVTPPTSYEAVTVFSRASFKDAKTSMVVSQRIGILHDIFGIKNTYVDLRGFGGFNISDGNAATGGLILAGYVPLAKEVTFRFGPVIEISAGQHPQLGVSFGLQFNWGK